MRQGNDYEHRDALKGNVLFAIFYLGEGDAANLLI